MWDVFLYAISEATRITSFNTFLKKYQCKVYGKIGNWKITVAFAKPLLFSGTYDTEISDPRGGQTNSCLLYRGVLSHHASSETVSKYGFPTKLLILKN